MQSGGGPNNGFLFPPLGAILVPDRLLAQETTEDKTLFTPPAQAGQQTEHQQEEQAELDSLTIEFLTQIFGGATAEQGQQMHMHAQG